MGLLPDLLQNQVNTITFVLVDSSSLEVTGLGNGFTLQWAKGIGAFAASAGTKGEIGNGWYYYQNAVAECDTPGPVSIVITHASIAQQNLSYVVREPNIGGIEFTYTLTDSGTGDPIEGAEIWITTDLAGSAVVWLGTTDAFGVARDTNDYLPRLDAGTYYVWRQKAGYTFSDPDTETVS
jgi:hypothetical protein